MILAHPGEVDLEGASTFIIGALYHIIPHLRRAGDLLLQEIPDSFAKSRNEEGGSG